MQSHVKIPGAHNLRDLTNSRSSGVMGWRWPASQTAQGRKLEGSMTLRPKKISLRDINHCFKGVSVKAELDFSGLFRGAETGLIGGPA